MKKKRDVLFLLQFFYPEYVSSATLPYDTATALAKAGLSVDVLCGYPHEYTDQEDLPMQETVGDIHIRRVKYLQLSRKKALGRIINYLSLTVSMLFRIFSMKKYKTIIVYSNPPILPLVAAWAAKLFKCRLFFVAYDLYPEIALRTKALDAGSMVTRLMNHINRVVYKQADGVVALSSEMKAYIAENRNIAAHKIHVIPNWYEDAYRPAGDTAENPFRALVKDRFVVGYFGNMGLAQDMEGIKAAMRHYKNDDQVCFLLSGHGAKHSQIEEMIRTEGIENAYLQGFLKGQAYLDALHVSHCAIVSLEKGLTGLCVPSKTYGFMMQGLPIVAIMDESDIVTDACNGAGYHIPENSPQGLIDLIAQCKQDPAACREKGARSRQIYLANYTPDICLDKYVRLLTDR